jgi:ribosomal protein L15
MFQVLDEHDNYFPSVSNHSAHSHPLTSLREIRLEYERNLENMQRTRPVARFHLYGSLKEYAGFEYHPATAMFPLLHSNNLLAKPRNNWKDFEGRKAFDEDHALPVVGTKLNELTEVHKFSSFDMHLNPNLVESVQSLKPSEEYVGMRSGHYMNHFGWVKIGGTWKFGRTYNDKRNQYAVGTWQERKMTPRFMLAPRVSQSGPRARHEGKLQYSTVSLSKLLWAFDTGRLNKNEVITAYHLLHSGVVSKRECVWPGFAITGGSATTVPYPIHFELQSATPRAIKLIEEAGGSFTAGYLTGEGILQELEPEKFPVFVDQDLPQRSHIESTAANPKKRGFLTRWYDDEAKYAHPEAGRRMAHYVKPPQDRDFPTTVEELDMVKHQQKWHLNQPGTGTVLPWHSLNTHDLTRRSSGAL